MSFPEVLLVITELLAWVGLGVGVPVFVVALIVRIADGQWHQVDVEIVDADPGGGTPLVRWFADAELHERALTPEERDSIIDPDTATGYAARSGRLRFERHGTAGRVLWVLSLAVLGVGVVALAVNVILMLVG